MNATPQTTVVWRRSHILPAAAVVVGCVAAPAAAQSGLSISWYTIDGGGGTTSGGAFTLSGTIGQPDASVDASMSGGAFILVGGFWPGIGPPPCRADFNRDGTVNSQDFFDFLSAFFANVPSADFNADGLINSQDFFDFLGAFFAGC